MSYLSLAVVPEQDKIDEQRASLNDLPVEILIHIGTYLDAADYDGPGTRSLQALMNCNKRCRSVLRPIYWDEVQLSSRKQWERLLLLLQDNAIGDVQTTLPSLIRALCLDVEHAKDPFNVQNIYDMVEILPHLCRLQVYANWHSPNWPAYISPIHMDYLAALGNSLTSLWIGGGYDQPLQPVIGLLRKLPLLEALSLYNLYKTPSLPEDVRDDAGDQHESEPLRLTNLTSFYAEGIFPLEDPQLHFVQEALGLKKLVFRNTNIVCSYVHSLLAKRGETLLHFELDADGGYDGTEQYLYKSMAEGRLGVTAELRTLASRLSTPNRIGNEIVRYIPNVQHLSLGGLTCITAAVFDEIHKAGLRLRTLQFFETWPFPTNILAYASGSSTEHWQEALLAAPLGPVHNEASGITPNDVLEALKDGKLHVGRLIFVGMSYLWDPQTNVGAMQVKLECEKRGIDFVCR